MCAELFALGAFWLLLLSPWVYAWVMDFIEIYNEERKTRDE